MRATVTRKGNAQARLGRLREALKGPRTVKVGFPASTDGDLINRAVWNEFGTEDGHIPERPFMRDAMKRGLPDYLKLIKADAKRIAGGKLTMAMALTRLGIKAMGDIQREIVDGVFVVNAPATIARKGSDQQLIDTGEMRQRVTFEVEE